ncbi:MAG: c-type cytochrome biogenesis protein CcmI [Burkholderiales bacterium]|nr:c-type cytochrome biogenesis protein CcmI [Burkholderiales bacterium]
MTGFAVVAGILVIVALGWLIVPLMRTGRAREVERGASNVAILRDQLAELDADLRAGTLSRTQYDQSRDEIERRVLEEAGAEARPATAPRGGAWTAVALAVAVPIAAGLMYLQLGSPNALRPQSAAPRHEVTQQEIEGLIAKLEARLRENPDPKGYLILGRTYYATQRFPEAVAAFERVGEQGMHDPDYLADYADALAVAQGRTLAGKPLALVQRALALDPNHLKALALAGSEAFERKDYKAAVAYWERLRAVAPADSAFAQSVTSGIEEARELGGLAGKAPAAAPAPPAGSAGATATAAASSARIQGVVTLSPALAAKASPDDTVFIFARAATGPRMPLAIVRRQVKDLPAKFSLDDSQAMAPGMSLSDFGDVVVGARVSRTATATPQAGDLEGFSGSVRVGATDVAVVIDKVLP